MSKRSIRKRRHLNFFDPLKMRLTMERAEQLVRDQGGDFVELLRRAGEALPKTSPPWPRTEPLTEKELAAAREFLWGEDADAWCRAVDGRAVVLEPGEPSR